MVPLTNKVTHDVMNSITNNSPIVYHYTVLILVFTLVQNSFNLDLMLYDKIKMVLISTLNHHLKH